MSQLDGKDVALMLQITHPEVTPRGVIGGPPCQAFSMGNVTNNHQSELRRELPARYALIIKELNQEFDLDFFVFENVRGITFAKYRRDFARFKGLFEDAGFTIFEGLLDAQYYGVAQKRPRVFVVGWNEKRFADWNFTFPEPWRSTPLHVDDKIRDLPPPAYFKRGLRPEEIPHRPNHWTMQPKSKRFQDGSLLEPQGKGRSFRVLAWNEPSATVAYGHREIHIHPSGKRRLSIYEAMLLQGFPEDYVLTGTLSDQVRQVCDAVPPPLASALARQVRLFLAGDSGVRVPVSKQLLLINE